MSTSCCQTEFQVLPVFFGERGNRQRRAGQVNALMFSQLSAIDDFAFHVLPVDIGDAQLDQAIAKQDPGAGTKLFG